VYDSTAEFDYSLDQIKELLRATEKHWVLQVQLAVGRAKEAKANPEHLENLTRALIRDFGLQALSDLRVTEAFDITVRAAAMITDQRLRILEAVWTNPRPWPKGWTVDSGDDLLTEDAITDGGLVRVSEEHTLSTKTPLRLTRT
jgi:hypothetical protein